MENTQARVERIRAILHECLTAQEREEVMQGVWERFCKECYRTLRPDERCRCWNDE